MTKVVVDTKRLEHKFEQTFGGWSMVRYTKGVISFHVPIGDGVWTEIKCACEEYKEEKNDGKENQGD